jgi:hypothetical protein
VAAALVALALVPAAAQAIDGQQAIRHIRQLVAKDCYSYPGFRCLGWDVWHCWKISNRKVRCKSLQEYEHHGNWRICKFATSAVEESDGNLVRLYFGAARCYSESGAEIR